MDFLLGKSKLIQIVRLRITGGGAISLVIIY